jgi:signal transduction histidine kinase
MTDLPAPVSIGQSAIFGIALALTALLLSLFGGGDVMTGVALAACAGALAALRLRGLAAACAASLLITALLQDAHDLRAAEAVAIALLSAVVVLPRRPLPSFTSWHWAAIPLIVMMADLATRWVPHGGVPWIGLVLVGASGGAVGGYGISRRMIGSGALAVGARYAIGDNQWLSQTTRFLLLGRIAGGMSHELSQALNVITMANGNLGYVLDRANVPEPQGTQLTERVRKIATHADVAARMLSHFRWFGQDGGREGAEMTVGTALERAVAATKAAARKCGVAIEIRGDALGHPVPLRHGTIEMMATAALLEVIQMLAQRPPDSLPPQPIALEATRTATDIEISVLSRSGDDAPSVPDDVADATFDLVTRLAASCRSELRRIGQKGYPVRFILRLDRDIV